jgi:hypothetical protein
MKIKTYFRESKIFHMPDTYHIRIKKDYAAAVIEDLQKMDAVEFIADNSTDIPDWQMELGKKELQNIASGNTELLSWDEAKKQFKL